MVTNKDLEFWSKMGGRTVPPDSVPKGDGNKEKPPVDEVVERLKKAATDGEAIRMFREGLSGPQPPPAPAPASPQESPTASIVTGAFNAQNQILTLLSNQVSGMREETAKLFQAQVDEKLEVLNERMKSLQTKEAEALKTAQEAHGQGARMGDLDYFVKVKSDLEKIGLWHPAQPGPAEKPSGVSDTVQLELARMRFDHDLQLAKITADTKRQDREWDIKLLQFKEDAEQRWGEHKDKLKFRDSTIGGLTDLGKSIAAAVQGGARGTEASPPAAPPVGASPNTPPKLYQFLCETEGCGETITITGDSEKAQCGKCNAQYVLKPKGA